MFNMENCETCKECGGQISCDEEKYVLLGTYHDPNDIESESFFHFDCWRKFINDAINKKSMGMVTDQASKIMSIAKPLLDSIIKPAETKLKEEITKERERVERKLREPQSAQDYINLS